MIKAKSHGNLTKLNAISDNNVNINVNLGFITPIHQQLECLSQYTDQTKEFVACALAPAICDEENPITIASYRNYWYEASQYCQITRERYVSFLQKVRKKKRRNSQ